MYELILTFFKNIGLIFIFILMVCFILPITIKLSGKRKPEGKKIFLTKENIIRESKLFYGISTMIFFMFFMIIGAIIIFSGIKVNPAIPNRITAIIFGSLFVLIPLSLIVKALIKCKRVFKGDYVIVIDTLKDKEKIINHDTELNQGRNWYYLFFEDYFKKYNKKVSVSQAVFDKANQEDKFYLVFVQNDLYVFNANDYELSEAGKIIHIEELGNYIDVAEFKLEENNSIVRINKKRIINDFFDKKQKLTAISFVLISVFLLCFAVCALLVFNNVFAFIISLLIFTLWVFFTVVKVKYLFDVIKNINRDNFEVKIDKVISLNDNIDFKDSNEIISFKFEKYKKIVYADKKDFNDVSVKDECFLVFVNGEKEPIKVYSVKNSILEENIILIK